MVDTDSGSQLLYIPATILDSSSMHAVETTVLINP